MIFAIGIIIFLKVHVVLSGCSGSGFPVEWTTGSAWFITEDTKRQFTSGYVMTDYDVNSGVQIAPSPNCEDEFYDADTGYYYYLFHFPGTSIYDHETTNTQMCHAFKYSNGIIREFSEIIGGAGMFNTAEFCTRVFGSTRPGYVLTKVKPPTIKKAFKKSPGMMELRNKLTKTTTPLSVMPMMPLMSVPLTTPRTRIKRQATNGNNGNPPTAPPGQSNTNGNSNSPNAGNGVIKTTTPYPVITYDSAWTKINNAFRDLYWPWWILVGTVVLGGFAGCGLLTYVYIRKRQRAKVNSEKPGLDGPVVSVSGPHRVLPNFTGIRKHRFILVSEKRQLGMDF